MSADRPSQADAPVVDAAEEDPTVAPGATSDGVPTAPSDPADAPVDPDGPTNPA